MSNRLEEKIREAEVGMRGSEDVKKLILDAVRYRYLRDIRRRDAITLRGPDAGVWCDCEDEDGILTLLTENDLDVTIDVAIMKGERY